MAATNLADDEIDMEVFRYGSLCIQDREDKSDFFKNRCIRHNVGIKDTQNYGKLPVSVLLFYLVLNLISVVRRILDTTEPKVILIPYHIILQHEQ
jgi:hypothetical protein